VSAKAVLLRVATIALPFLQFLQNFFESVVTVFPEAAVGPEPIVQFLEWLRPEAVDPLLGHWTNVHQPRVAEDAQVLGDLGLTQPKLVHYLPDRARSIEEQLHDLQPVWLSQ